METRVFVVDRGHVTSAPSRTKLDYQHSVMDLAHMMVMETAKKGKKSSGLGVSYTLSGGSFTTQLDRVCNMPNR